MNISIVGLGLIGGSIALKLKTFGHYIVGIDANEKHCAMAKDLGLVDEILDFENGIESTDMVILAIPVDHMETVLHQALNTIKWNQVIVDVGSTKLSLCQSVKTHEKRGRFVAAHPLAGTEFSGPQAAFLTLFEGKKNIICEEEMSDEDALEKTINIFTQLGMQSLFMDPTDHDRHLAYVSHLSHLSSFVLGLTVLDIEKDQKQILNLAGTGFESTVRLAKSSPDTWSAIFDKNSQNLSDALTSYIGHLEEFKILLDTRNKEGVKAKMKSANRIKQILKGIKMNVLKLS